MNRNDQQQRSENRPLQNNIQLLFIAAGVVFLVAGLALAAIGATSNGVTDSDDGAEDGGDVDDNFGDDEDDWPGDDAEDVPGDEDDLPDDNETDDVPDDDTGDDDTGDDDTGGDDTGGDEEDPTHALTVNVQDEGGNPIDGATVGVDGGPDSFDAIEEGGVGGSIEFEVEDGEYTVAADAEGYERAEEAVAVSGENAEVTLTLPASQDGGDTRTLRIIVVDNNNNPIPHATVEVGEGGLFDSPESQPVDGHGVAEFEVEDGHYEYTVEADGYPTANRETTMEGASKEITVTLSTND